MRNIISTTINLLENLFDFQLTKVKKFFFENQEVWKSLPFLLAIAFLFYFSSLSFFSIAIDNEGAAFRQNPDVWIMQGRWTAYFIELVFAKTTVPFLTTALFCIAAAVSYIFLLISHNLKISPLTYLAFPLFSAFPIWKHLGLFTASMPAMAWGLLVSCIAAYLFSKVIDIILSRGNGSLLSNNVVYLTLSQAFLIALAVGAYQSFIIVFACFGLGIIMLRILSDPEIDFYKLTKILSSIIVTILLSLSIYTAIEYSLLYVLNLKISYIQGFYHPDQLLEHPIQVIYLVFEHATTFYLGDPSLFGILLRTPKFIIILGMLTVLFSAIPSHSTRKFSLKLVLIGLSLSSLLAPFALSFMSGYILPFRALIAAPYVIWLFAILAIISRSKIMKMLGVVAISCALFHILYLSCISAATRQITQQHDFIVASQIYERVALANTNFNPDKIYNIDFFGALPIRTIYPKSFQSTEGASFFEWDGGNVTRILLFMRFIGYPNLRSLSIEERTKLIPIYEAMPSWPAAGSVKVIKDLTLVKLGNIKGLGY